MGRPLGSSVPAIVSYIDTNVVLSALAMNMVSPSLVCQDYPYSGYIYAGIRAHALIDQRGKIILVTDNTSRSRPVQ